MYRCTSELGLMVVVNIVKGQVDFVSLKVIRGQASFIKVKMAVT